MHHKKKAEQTKMKIPRKIIIIKFTSLIWIVLRLQFIISARLQYYYKSQSQL